MNSPCDQLLTCAALPRDADGQVGLDHAVQHLEDLAHGGGRADDLVVVVAAALSGQLLAHHGQLGVAVANLAAQAGVQALDLIPGHAQGVVVFQQGVHLARVANRDGGQGGKVLGNI